MGFFSNLFSNLFSEPVITVDTLPDNVEKLDKLYSKTDDPVIKYHILEKLRGLNGLGSDKQKELIRCYLEGIGCQQDFGKARDLLYLELAQGYFYSLKYFAKLLHTVEPDYDQLLRSIAEGIVQRRTRKIYIEENIKGAACMFHLLRDMVHLCELGLKDAKNREQERAFFDAHCNYDWTTQFYGFYLPNEGGYYGADKEWFASVMNEDSLVAINELDQVWPEPIMTTSSNSLSEYRDKARKRTAYRDSLFHKYDADYVAERTLVDDFKSHYMTMSVQEMLDFLYTEDAAAQAVKRAEEERCRKEEERIYQQRLQTISGRMYLAKQAWIDDNYQEAEEHLHAACLIQPDCEEEYESAIALYGQYSRIFQEQNDISRAMQYAVTFFDLYHAAFPEDTTWNEHRTGVLMLRAYDLYFVYEHYKHGPKHGKKHKANDYISITVKVFSRAHCMALRKQIADNIDPLKSALNLALHLIDNHPNDMHDAKYWFDWCINQKYIPALYLGAAERSRELGLSDIEVHQYLHYVAQYGDSEYAGMARDRLTIMKLEAKKAAKVRQMVNAYRQAQYQMQVDTHMEQYRKELDSTERRLNFFFSGDFSTMEEKIARGELSAKQAIDYQDLRWEAERRMQKKISLDITSHNL